MKLTIQQIIDKLNEMPDKSQTLKLHYLFKDEFVNKKVTNLFLSTKMKEGRINIVMEDLKSKEIPDIATDETRSNGPRA